MKENLHKRILTVLLVVFICAALIEGLNLDHQNKADSPPFRYYVENHQKTGADNLVESVLLDYRAFDTFGEVMILYVAITGILILGKKIFHPSEKKEKEESKEVKKT